MAAAKDKHGVEIARVDVDDSDDNESASGGTRKPTWLQALAAAANPDGGVSGTPRKKARGGEAQFLFCLDRVRAYTAQNAKAKPPAIAAKHDNPEDRTNQRPYGGHGKAEAPEVPAKGGRGIKIASHDEDDSDDNEIACVGATKPALLQASAAAAVRGEVGANRGNGGAGMYPDNGVAAAAKFVPGAKGSMPNDKARAALESFTGAEVVRRALAALRDDTDEEEEQDNNNEEEPSNNGNEDGFVITQDNDTKDKETLGSEAPKVQQAGGRKAHQQTQKEAHHLAGRGGGTLGLALDGEDGKTRGSKARPGNWAINEDINARAPEARQGSLALDASKSHRKINEAAHHPAYLGSGTHRRASEGEDEKDWAPKATQVEDAEAWVQAEEASYAVAQKKPNHAAHQGGGTRSPPGRTALLGSAVLFGPATSSKIKGKTG